MKVYAFRHGQTDWNAQKLLQGHLDIPLNSIGIEQAKVLAEKMKNIPLDLVVSSDLSRAKETAKLVLEGRNIPIEYNQDCREVHFGQATGLKRSELSHRFQGNIWERFLSTKREDLDFAFPGGETKKEQLQKVLKIIDQKFNEGCKSLGISSHGGVVIKLIPYALDYPEDLEVFVKNCTCYEFEYDGKNLKLLGEI